MAFLKVKIVIAGSLSDKNIVSLTNHYIHLGSVYNFEVDYCVGSAWSENPLSTSLQELSLSFCLNISLPLAVFYLMKIFEADLQLIVQKGHPEYARLYFDEVLFLSI